MEYLPTYQIANTCLPCFISYHPNTESPRKLP